MNAPDYDLADSMDVTTSEQHRAVGNRTRMQILGVLNDRAATITQLAGILGVLKGSTSYHVRMLEQAGLVRVVRTRKVRGVVERYYGRTARRFELDTPETPSPRPGMLLRVAADEVDHGPRAVDPDMVTSAHAGLDSSRAREFRRRLEKLIEEFRSTGRPDEPQWGLVVGLYRTGVGAAPAAEHP